MKWCMFGRHYPVYSARLYSDMSGLYVYSTSFCCHYKGNVLREFTEVA